MRKRIHAWRERRALDELADAQHALNLKGHHFGVRPSRKRAMRERVEKAERRLAKLQGDIGHLDDLA